jgi:hypothetical protein
MRRDWERRVASAVLVWATIGGVITWIERRIRPRHGHETLPPAAPQRPFPAGFQHLETAAAPLPYLAASESSLRLVPVPCTHSRHGAADARGRR